MICSTSTPTVSYLIFHCLPPHLPLSFTSYTVSQCLSHHFPLSPNVFQSATKHSESTGQGLNKHNKLVKICIITILMCSVILWRMLSPPSSRVTLVEKNTTVMGLAIILYNQDNNSRQPLTQYMCMCTLVSYRCAHIVNEVFVSWSSWSGCLGKAHSCHQMLWFINNGYFCLPVGLALSKSLIWMSLDKTSPVLITKSCEVVLVLPYNALLAFLLFLLFSIWQNIQE